VIIDFILANMTVYASINFVTCNFATNNYWCFCYL